MPFPKFYSSHMYHIRNLLSWHDLASAWNHAKDMVAVIPLTGNVCITHQEIFSLKCYSMLCVKPFITSS